MSRGITSSTLTAISSQSGFYPVVLVSVDWPGAPIYAHTGTGNISWDGHTWAGVGNFARLSLPTDEGGMAASEGSIGMVGLDDTLNDYLEDDVRGRPVDVYFGATTDRAGNTLVGDPFPVFSGSIGGMTDQVTIENGDVMRGLMLEIYSGPSQRSTSAARHSDEDQKATYPTDTAGRHLRGIENEGIRYRWPE